MRIILSFLGILLLHNAFAHRILGIFPLAAKSHDALFQSIVETLAERGHEMTIIRSLPTSSKPSQNYKEFLLRDMEPLVGVFNLEVRNSTRNYNY